MPISLINVVKSCFCLSLNRKNIPMKKTTIIIAIFKSNCLKVKDNATIKPIKKIKEYEYFSGLHSFINSYAAPEINKNRIIEK